MKDKAFWFLAWPLVMSALVGYGMLGPGAHPWTGWSDAFAGGGNVLMGVAMGALLGLRIRQAVSDSLMKWATGSDSLYEQEYREHEKTAEVLFDLAYGAISDAAARTYLAQLDAREEEDPDEEETH